MLSDVDIQSWLDDTLVITSEREDWRLHVGPASVDLHLGHGYQRLIPTSNETIEVGDARLSDHFEGVSTEEDGFIVIEPGEYILATTEEYVEIPRQLTASVAGRSSIGRLGITVHITAGFIDPGFKGQITLEVANLGPRPVIIPVHTRVCQLVFTETRTSCERPYSGRYQGQKGATVSRIAEVKS